MKAEQLWGSILQDAIQGKLVPQLDEEPEVEQVGEVPEDVPFEIPEKWKWVNLDSACLYIQRGKSPKYSDIQQIPVIAQKCNQWEGFQISKAKFIDPSTAKAYQQERWLQDLDVLWNSTGIGTLGRLAVYEVRLNPYKKAVADSHVTVIRADKQKLDPLYLFAYLKNPSVQSVIEEQADGSTKQKELATKTIKSYPLPLPPLSEQRRIVVRLNELKPLVDAYGKEQEQLERLEATMPEKLKASLLQEAIQGKLVPQLNEEPVVEQIGEAPDEVPFAIPEKWKWATISSVLQYGCSKQVNGVDIPASSWILDLEDIEAGSGLLISKNRERKSISNKTPFKKGDVLYGKLRPYLNKCIVADEDGYCTPEIVPIRSAFDACEIIPQYIQAFLMSPFFMNYANSCSYGVKMPRLGTKDAKAAPFPIPPVAEQYRIVNRLNELFHEIGHMKFKE